MLLASKSLYQVWAPSFSITYFIYCTYAAFPLKNYAYVNLWVTSIRGVPKGKPQILDRMARGPVCKHLRPPKTSYIAQYNTDDLSQTLTAGALPPHTKTLYLKERLSNNPISNEGRIAILKGCIESNSLEQIISQISIPLLAIHSKHKDKRFSHVYGCN